MRKIVYSAIGWSAGICIVACSSLSAERFGVVGSVGQALTEDGGSEGCGEETDAGVPHDFATSMGTDPSTCRLDCTENGTYNQFICPVHSLCKDGKRCVVGTGTPGSACTYDATKNSQLTEYGNCVAFPDSPQTCASHSNPDGSNDCVPTTSGGCQCEGRNYGTPPYPPYSVERTSTEICESIPSQ